MLRASSIVLAFSFVVGCVPQEPPPPEVLDRRVEIPPAPELGVQLLQPETVVPAGTEVQSCWVSDWVPEQDTFVKAFIAHQGDGGHHIIGMATDVPRQPGEVFDCTSASQMATLRPVVLPSRGEGGFDAAATLPEGFMVRVAAGTRLVMQSHYVNAELQDILVRDVVNLEFVPDAEIPDQVEANYFTFTDVGFDLPPGPQEITVTCDVTETWQFFFIFSHMHEQGAYTSITLERGSGEVETLVDIDQWEPSMRDAPPTNNYEPSAPLVLEAGDRLVLTCGWDNKKGRNLRFPEEMCAALAGYFPAKPEGFHICGS